MEVLATITAALLIFFVCATIYIKRAFGYWKRRNIPYAKPTMPLGTIVKTFLQQSSFGEEFASYYHEARALNHKHYGLFALWKPSYMPIDPDIIKNILTKDFNYFVDRGMFYNEKDDPISAHLFSLGGSKWKLLRSKLSPTFSSGKMKMMFEILLDAGNNLQNALEPIREKPVDIKKMLGCYTTDVIGSCAFGLNCNSFENPNSDFKKNVKDIFENSLQRAFIGFFTFCFPSLSLRLGLKIVPGDSGNFFIKLVNSMVKYREENDVQRNDFMQLLINMRNSSSENQLTLEEIAAQAFIFFFAGYETSATTMTFALFEMCLNTSIQDRVREEINSTLEKYDGKVTYEAMSDMKYLEQVVDETLRKYPPGTLLNRKCVADYKIPGTDTIIEKGTNIFVCPLGLHHDPEYFPEPEKFNPDRFSKENRNKIVPFTYLPFGEGPRNCIGLRFGLMQVKVGLIMLLKNYVFALNPTTEIPLKISPHNFILTTLGKIWLDVEKIDK